MAKLSRIAPEFPVADLAHSLTYYQQQLGFEIALAIGSDYAIVERDGIAIHLFQQDSAPSTPVAIHIFADDLEGLHMELLGRGAYVLQGIERKPWGNRDFRVRDESGNQIKFTEPLAA